MDMKREKCVLILDEALPAGLAANTAAILGITLGQRLPDLVGPDVADHSGAVHLGVVAMPVPILKASAPQLKELRAQLAEEPFSALTVVDFCDVAQRCNTYDDYTAQMGYTPTTGLGYLGIALCGDKKLVNRLCGSLPLFR